ncbi:MAG TPA: flagellin [Xanthobacteraceae bacterium]|nr:flagellin [Xanthobacteraceae bacterium]
MADITLTAGVRQNLLSLQKTADLMATTQNRLATGKKINSALDNPISFFTSQSLSNRASDLSTLLDSISNATQTLQAADNGLTSLTKLVQSAQAIAQQAQQSASTSAKVTGSVSGLTATTVHAFTATKTLTVSDGTTTATYTAAAADDVQDVLDAINNTVGIKVQASLTSDGKLQLLNLEGGNVVIGGTGSAADLLTLGLVAGTTTGTINTTRSSLASQFDSLRTQIDQLAADSGYNGVNLLNGDNLTVTFNETATSTQSITGVTFNSTGLGIAAAGNTFQTDVDVSAALADLTSALSTLRSQAVSFGSSLSVVQTRQDFTKAMVNTLQTGADNLVLADTNLEGANMLALQTRQSLSTTALSLAAQASQSVLRLFG